MRKIFGVLLVLLGMQSAAFALGLNGVTTADQGKVAVTLGSDYSFRRDIRTMDNPGDPVVNYNNSYMTNIYHESLKVTYGVVDHLNLYVKLGVVGMKGKEEVSHAGNAFDVGHWTVDPSVFGGTGLHAFYDFSDILTIGCDAQILAHKNNAKYEGAHEKIKFCEWQVAPYIAKKIKNLTPYVGAKYNDMRHKEVIGGKEYRYKSRMVAGMFTGADYAISSHLSVNIEGTFFSETAISSGVTYKF